MAAENVLRSPARSCSLDRSTGNFGSPARKIARTTTSWSRMHTDSHYATTWLKEDNTQCVSISESDKKIISLLKTVPRERHVPFLSRFLLYENVLQVYEAVSSGKVLSSMLRAQMSSDVGLKRRIYQMVFDVLNHKEVIEEILNESSFYSSHFDLLCHETLVLIMAYDFLAEKFTIRLPKGEVDNLPRNVIKVSQALWKHKVKLSATLARMRVKENALTMSQLIPDSHVKCKYIEYQGIPYCMRINPIKVKNAHRNILSQLQQEGYSVVQHHRDLCKQKKSVYQASRDLIFFSPDCKASVDTHELTTSGYLTVQNLTSYCAIEQLRCYIEQCHGDVVLTNYSLGVEVLHIASILGERGTVKVFGVPSSQVPSLNLKLFQLGLNNVQHFSEPLTSACPSDDSLANVRLVVCLPTSSSSHLPTTAHLHVVDYVLQEGDDHLAALDLRPNSSVASTAQQNGGQAEIIALALNFEQAEHIMCVSCSREEATRKAMLRNLSEQHKADVENTYKRVFSVSTHPCLAVLVDVAVLVDINTRELLKKEHRYSVVVLDREKEKPSLTAKEVIARAVANGVIRISGGASDMITSQGQIKKPKNKGRIYNLHHGIPTTMLTQKKVVKNKVEENSKRLLL